MDDGESVLSLISSKLNYVGPGMARGERGEGINQQLALGEYNETQGYLGRMSELCLVWSLNIMMIIPKYFACNI